MRSAMYTGSDAVQRCVMTAALCKRRCIGCLLFGVLHSTSAEDHTDSAANIFCTARKCSLPTCPSTTVSSSQDPSLAWDCT